MWKIVHKKRGGAALALWSLALVLVFVTTVFPDDLAIAQQIPADILQQLQDRGAGTPGTTGTPETKPTVQTYTPVADQGEAPPSRLENIYSARSGRELKQVGYNTLGAAATISVAQTGSLQDTYVLGVGDELTFELRGQENSSYRQRVDRSGRIVLPKLNPISAAGRTMAEFRQSLEAEVSRAYVSTKVFVSLGEVHQVSVLVSGYVRTPGMRIVSALASPLDAILLSGGIQKAGSLRNIKLIRKGTVRTIDLYALVLTGSPVNLGMLQDGDRIFVSPLGQTVAIAGSVRRPGIYELFGAATATSVTALISLAGGTEIANSYDLSKAMLDRDGTTRLIPIAKGAVVNSGEIVFVDPSRTADLDRVTIAGEVQNGGQRPLSMVRTTAELFHSVNDLLPTAYTPFAIIVRHSATSNSVSIVAFSLIRALTHTGGIPLQSNDYVYIFSVADIRALTRVVTKDVNKPYNPAPPPTGNGTGLAGTNGAGPSSMIAPGAAALQAAAPVGGANGGTPSGRPSATGPDGSSATSLGGSVTSTNNAGNLVGSMDPRYRAAQSGSSPEGAALAAAQALIQSEAGGTPSSTAVTPETDNQTADRIADSLHVSRELVEHAVSDHLVWVLDQVHVPGVYAAAEGTTLSEMIDAAGGPMRQADLSAVEVTSTELDRNSGISHTTRNSYAVADPSFAGISVLPLDVIRLRQVYSDRTGETVTVAGQVRYPGVFDIMRDERLSSVLQRAGGLTEVSYPYGAIFTRRSAAIHEQEGNDRSARELQGELAVLAAAPTQSPAGQTNNISFLASLVEAVRNAPTLGRISVTADPVVLASRPDLDMVLEPGDAIYIPKRPSSVGVSGEVLNPGSFEFRSSYDFKSYVRLAGGPTQAAYLDHAFIVLPDGSAMLTEDSWLSFDNASHIPPGSTIVVPRDLRPFDWGTFLKDATQIISQLAVSAASLSVLRSN